MEHGVVPKESLEVDRDEKMDRDTREKIKVINGQQVFELIVRLCEAV